MVITVNDYEEISLVYILWWDYEFNLTEELRRIDEYKLSLISKPNVLPWGLIFYYL